jgi:hypothetical protein
MFDPDRRKSLVAPLRRRFTLEKAGDAVFQTPHRGENTDVVVCEGVEDCLSVLRFGKPRCRVIGIPGAGTLKYLAFPKGTKVTVVLDGDAPDSAAARAVQDGLDHLILQGGEVFVTARPPLGADANWILQEAGVDGLIAFLDSTTPATLSLRGEIERLARLSDFDYELEREAAVKDLAARGFKVRISFLDKKVREARVQLAAEQEEPEFFDLGATQPWPEEVDGADLLDDLAEAIGDYVVISKEQLWCVALWVAFAHCFAAAACAPKLWINSAEKRSGKSRLLQVLRHLVTRPLSAEYISPSAIFRIIEAQRPTLLLDEIDTYFKDNEAIRGIFNSGFDPQGGAIISVPSGDGWEAKRFSTWAPQAMAGLGEVADTVADRSFRIELERKPRDKTVKRLRHRDVGPLVDLAQKAVRWSADHCKDLVGAAPTMPRGLNDRASDAWELCIALAIVLGGTGRNRPDKQRCGSAETMRHLRRASWYSCFRILGMHSINA